VAADFFSFGAGFSGGAGLWTVVFTGAGFLFIGIGSCGAALAAGPWINAGSLIKPADSLFFGVGSGDAGPWAVVLTGINFLFFGIGSDAMGAGAGPWTDAMGAGAGPWTVVLTGTDFLFFGMGSDAVGAGAGVGGVFFGSYGDFLFLITGAELLDFLILAPWAGVPSGTAVSFVADIQLLFSHRWVRLVFPRSSKILVSSSTSWTFSGADRRDIFLVTALAFGGDFMFAGFGAGFALFMVILILGLGLGKR
jgi:hypothetical protein